MLNVNVAVMGIRAVQAGALTAAIDRPLLADHPEMLDYARAAGFRELCAELNENPAILAHRYALSLPTDTLVLRRQEPSGTGGVRTPPRPRRVLCLPDLMARIDASVA